MRQDGNRNNDRRDNRSGSGGFRSGGNRNNSGNRDGGNRFGGNRSNGNRFSGRSGGFKRNNFNSGPREMHKAKCAECKKDCEVPFKPTGDKPVYCRECFAKHRKF